MRRWMIGAALLGLAASCAGQDRASTVRLVADEPVTVGAGPIGIAATERLVVVANNDDATVTAIEPSSRTVRWTAVVPDAVGIAMDVDAVWVSGPAGGPTRTETDESGGTFEYQLGSVTRLSPDDGSEVVRIDGGRNTRQVAIGLGSVWITNREDGTVQRIDPATNRTVRTYGVAAGLSLVAVTDRYVWLTAVDGATGIGSLHRLDPTTGEVVAIDLTSATTGDTVSAPTAITVADDTVLVVLSTPGGGPTALATIDAGTAATPSLVSLDGFRSGTGLAVVDGRVVVADCLASRVAVVDPRSGATVGTPLDVGTDGATCPGPIAAAGEELWVVLRDADAVLPVMLRE